MKRIIVEIGYNSYAVDAADAAAMFAIALRAVPVRHTDGGVFVQTVTEDAFLTSAQIAEYEALALPDDPEQPF